MDNQQQQNAATNAVVTGYADSQSSLPSQDANQLSSGMDQPTSGTTQASVNTNVVLAGRNPATANINSATSSANQAAGQGTKTVIGVFSDRPSAEKAIGELRNQGFGSEEINIIGQKGGSTTTYEDDVSDGALTGGTLGGIGGLLVGVGALAIPGVGPIVAAGPIAAALSGAVAGGIAGGLIDWGIPAETSRKYEQQVAQGGILAVIKTDSAKVQQAAQILRQGGAVDVESHSTK